MNIAQRRISKVAFCALLVCAACSKSKSAEMRAQPDLAPSASTAPLPAGSTLSKDPFDRPARAPETMKMPARNPPSDAQNGPGGVRWQLVREGSGDTAGPTDSIVGDYNVWNANGTLVESTYTQAKAGLFSGETLGEPFRPLLTAVKMGGQARFWVPRAALAGWRPETWPDADLIIEYEPIQVGHTKVTTVAAVAKQAGRFPSPDGAGPPANALRTASQVPYVVLEKGTTQRKPANGKRLELNIDAWALEGLIAKRVMQLPTATTLERAPKKLGEVLRQMSEGDTARVWLSAKDAKEIVPVAGDKELILDVTLSKVP